MMVGRDSEPLLGNLWEMAIRQKWFLCKSNIMRAKKIYFHLSDHEQRIIKAHLRQNILWEATFLTTIELYVPSSFCYINR